MQEKAEAMVLKEPLKTHTTNRPTKPRANFSQNNVVGLGFLASDRASKDSIPSKLLPDDPFEVPSYNACLSKYASQEWKAYWGIESDTKE
ncbi:hypothetical protein G6F43_000435 [Rhizopus delemar]|nr:hypothetical protein G6F43_000435 [Rhizopus delemar]